VYLANKGVNNKCQKKNSLYSNYMGGACVNFKQYRNEIWKDVFIIVCDLLIESNLKRCIFIYV